MQDIATGTLDPSTEANWKQRDKDLMSNLPYAQAAIPESYRRHIVEYHRKEAPGTIVVDSDTRYLYYVLPKGKAIRYGITVGEEAQAWSGIAKVGRMEEWPSGHPTAGEQPRLGPLPAFVTGGPHNPMGARAHVSVFRADKDTLYRIHGTNQPEYIGGADFLGLHPHDQRGRDRPLQSGQGRHDRGRAGAAAEQLGVARMAGTGGSSRTERLNGQRRKWRRVRRHFLCELFSAPSVI